MDNFIKLIKDNDPTNLPKKGRWFSSFKKKVSEIEPDDNSIKKAKSKKTDKLGKGMGDADNISEPLKNKGYFKIPKFKDLDRLKKAIIVTVAIASGFGIAYWVKVANMKDYQTDLSPAPSPSTEDCTKLVNPFTNENYANCTERDTKENECKQTKNPNKENENYRNCKEMYNLESECKAKEDPYGTGNYPDCQTMVTKENACKAIKHPNNSREICNKCPTLFKTESIKGSQSYSDDLIYYGSLEQCECNNNEVEQIDVYYKSCKNKKEEEECIKLDNGLFPGQKYLNCKHTKKDVSIFENNPRRNLNVLYDEDEIPKTSVDAYIRSHEIIKIWGLTESELYIEAERIREEENNFELANTIVNLWFKFNSLSDNQKQVFLSMTPAEQINVILSSEGLTLENGEIVVDQNNEDDDQDEDDDFSYSLDANEDKNDFSSKIDEYINKNQYDSNKVSNKKNNLVLILGIGGGVLLFLIILIIILKK